jgi:uncharacterized protein (TIGR04562 family)
MTSQTPIHHDDERRQLLMDYPPLINPPSQNDDASTGGVANTITTPDDGLADPLLALPALPWPQVAALLNGISSIDLDSLLIQTRDDALMFLRNYGYDIERNQEDSLVVRSIFQEAIAFIERRLLCPQGVHHDEASAYWQQLNEAPNPSSCQADGRIPATVRKCPDVATLLTWVSSNRSGTAPMAGAKPITSEESAWACAILKVMHTLAHIQHSPMYQALPVAREQILSRFSELVVHADTTDASHDQWMVAKGAITFGPHHKPLFLLPPHASGLMPLPLHSFAIKDGKTRESILVKLLCKKENVAEEIRDLLGIRLVTHTPAQAATALAWLCAHQVIVPPNIIPSRSRNSLIDAETFHQASQQLSSLGASTFNVHNPSSSHTYRAIHITGRQLVRTGEGDSIRQRFFFPFEVQITDADSERQSQHGDSDHKRYKQKQWATARRRVLGRLLMGR